jgi:hypothetical protein
MLQRMRLTTTPAAAAAIVICALAAGCSRQINMMPTPVIFQGGRVNPFTEVPEGAQRTTLEVL